jgi:hypothetical protein
MWKEGGMSRHVLRHVGRAAIFEKLTAGLNEDLVENLADGIYNQS